MASILRQWMVRLEPAVTRRTLARLSGAVWWAVGLGLVIAAARWLDGVPRDLASILAAGGLLAALLAGRAFRSIAANNLRRLASFPDRRCVFAFQSWRGYGTILLMIALGWGLRHSPIPKPWLVPVYLAMGGALMRGGVEYFRWTPDRPSDAD